MAIDTETKRRSVSGYSGIIIAPLADGVIGAAEREHVVGLYAGIGSTPPVPPVIGGYIGDTTIYDLDSPTGSITGGTVIDSDYRYD